MFDLQKFSDTPAFGLFSAEDKHKLDFASFRSISVNGDKAYFYGSADCTGEPAFVMQLAKGAKPIYKGAPYSSSYPLNYTINCQYVFPEPNYTETNRPHFHKDTSNKIYIELPRLARYYTIKQKDYISSKNAGNINQIQIYGS